MSEIITLDRRKPKTIAIGISAKGLARDEWMQWMSLLCYVMGRRTPHNLEFIRREGAHVDMNRNLIVLGAHDAGADFVFMSDTDNPPPPTIILDLMRHNRDIVGCDYPDRLGNRDSLAVTLGPDDRKKGLMKVRSIPMGATLIKMHVFRNMPFPWFVNKQNQPIEHPLRIGQKVDYSKITTQSNEATNFCHQAWDNGYAVWCDFDIQIQHLL